MISQTRIRHVKCGEEKPSCLRCRCTGRICDGYATEKKTQNPSVSTKSLAIRSHTSVNQRILPNPTTNLPGSDRERRSFHFYVQELGQDVSESLGIPSLHQLMYQLSHIDDAVREGIIALGALGERLLVNHLLTFDNAHANKIHGYALFQYGNALKHLHESLIYDPDRWAIQTLISCFLFTLFEFLQGNDIGARTHLSSGLKILHGSSVAQKANPSKCWNQRLALNFDSDLVTSSDNDLPLEHLKDLCSCGCGLSPGTHTETHQIDTLLAHVFPYEPIQPKFHHTHAKSANSANCEIFRAFTVMENAALSWLALDSWDTPLLAPIGVRKKEPACSDRFPSIADAADSLNCHVLQMRDLRRSFINGGHISSRFAPFIKAKQAELLAQLACWMRGMEDLRRRLGFLCTGESLQRVQVMRANYEFVYIFLHLFSYDQNPQDTLIALESHFKTIVSLGRSVLIDMDERTQKSQRLPSFIVPQAWRVRYPSTLFTFNEGIIQPLYFTAVKCQNSAIADEAIELLSSRPWRESAWDSSTMAKIAQRARAETD